MTTRHREPIPRRDLENNIEVDKYVDCSPENRTKSDFVANRDRQIYKFFSNSAPHNDCQVNYLNRPVGFNHHLSMIEPQRHHISTAIPNQHCNRCRRLLPILCNSCYRSDLNPSCYCCYQCNLLQNMDSCNNCRRAWVQSWNHYNGDVERYGANIYQRDNRPQILEITYQDHSSKTDRSTSPIIESTHSFDSNSSSLSHKTQHDKQSSTTHSDKIIETMSSNVPDTVSLSKDDEILELKRKNDMLIAKYAQNYGSLRKRKSILKETNSQFIDDSFPLPLMREHLTTSSSKGADNEKTQPNNVRKLEYKWEVCSIHIVVEDKS